MSSLSKCEAQIDPDKGERTRAHTHTHTHTSNISQLGVYWIDSFCSERKALFVGVTEKKIDNQIAISLHLHTDEENLVNTFQESNLPS